MKQVKKQSVTQKTYRGHVEKLAPLIIGIVCCIFSAGAVFTQDREEPILYVDVDS